jgi:hypothetical protein
LALSYSIRSLIVVVAALDTSIFHDFAEKPKTKKKKGKKGGDDDDVAPARSYVVADDDDMPTGACIPLDFEAWMSVQVISVRYTPLLLSPLSWVCALCRSRWI